jgi:DNA-binding NtrC family response regulator
VRPIGAHQEVPVDVRILSATHKDLGALATDGRFRQDLYYRINVIELHVPPLRARREDIPDLVAMVLQRLTQQGKTALLSDRAQEALLAYPFPGNVRELENVLERALTLCEGEVIEPADLDLKRPPVQEGAESPVLTTPTSTTTSTAWSASASPAPSRRPAATRPAPRGSSASPCAPCAIASKTSSCRAKVTRPPTGPVYRPRQPAGPGHGRSLMAFDGNPCAVCRLHRQCGLRP